MQYVSMIDDLTDANDVERVNYLLAAIGVRLAQAERALAARDRGLLAAAVQHLSHRAAELAAETEVVNG